MLQRGSRRRLGRPTLIVGVLVGAVVLAAPAVLLGVGIGGFVVVASAVAAMLVVVGVVLHRPRRAVAWALVAVGCAVHAVATSVLVVETGRTGTNGVGLPQAVAVLAYPALFVGILGITTRRPSSWSATSSTAIAAAVVGTATIGLAVTLPEIVRGELPLAGSDWAGVLALGDIVLAMLVVRRVVGASPRNWSWWLLVAGFVGWGNAHAEVGTRIADGTFDSGSAVALTLVAGPLLVGVAALVPSMATVPGPGARAERGGELASSAWFLVVAPIMLVVVRVAELDAARLWVIVPLAVLVAIAVGRTASLVGSLDDPVRAWRAEYPRPDGNRPELDI